MKYTFKRPLMLQILFYMSSVFTVLGLYLLIKRMVIDADAQTAMTMFSSKISSSYIYMGIAVVGLSFILKWFGVFLMYNRKTWGYILFIIPNLIFLAAMVYIIIYGFQTPTTFTIAGVTLLMIALYTVELFCLRGLRKKQISLI